MSGVPGSMAVDDEQAARVVTGFTHALAAAGVSGAVSSTVDLVEALGRVGWQRRSAVYWAGRATLVHRPEEIPVYDRVFDSYWLGRVAPATTDPGGSTFDVAFDREPEETPSTPEDAVDQGDIVAVRWSPVEVLRHRDLAALSEDEWSQVAPLVSRLRATTELRASRRLRRGRRGRGRPDVPATLRRAIRTDGELVGLSARRRSTQPRRLVLILDVSGSMEPYARALLRFAQAAVAARGPSRVEVFAIGTRLTRLTRHLGAHDPDRALRDAAATVVDLAGGTRLGESLRAFNDEWGIRGVARGATVVILSDGWDRGDPDHLAEEMARLSRVARRLVWVNPLRASPGYEPLARGMAAALPFVDQFVDGHSLDALTDLAALIGAPPSEPARSGISS